MIPQRFGRGTSKVEVERLPRRDNLNVLQVAHQAVLLVDDFGG